MQYFFSALHCNLTLHNVAMQWLHLPYSQKILRYDIFAVFADDQSAVKLFLVHENLQVSIILS